MSALGIWGDYLPVVQTGLQTLCIIGAGRLAAARGLFDPTPVCRTLNRFVVVACLPALQFWLLAIKTDMRNMEHWRAVGAFMLWTLLVQIACTAWVIMFEGGKLSRICVHALVLAANNTGILAPVVLEAAIGPSAAAVGMLATIVLYFQQLPTAMVLFELDRMAGRVHTPADSGSGGDVPALDFSIPIDDGKEPGSCEPCSSAAVEKLGREGGGSGGGSGSGGAWLSESAVARWVGGSGSGGGDDAEGGEGPKVGLRKVLVSPHRQHACSPGSVAAGAETASTPGVGVVHLRTVSSPRSGEVRAGGASGIWSGRSLSQRSWMVSPETSSPPPPPSLSPLGGGGDRKFPAEDAGGGGGPRAEGRRMAAKTASCVRIAIGSDERGGLGKAGKGGRGGGARLVAAAGGFDAEPGKGDGVDDEDSTVPARASVNGCTAGTASPWAPWASVSGLGGVGGSIPPGASQQPHHQQQQQAVQSYHASESLRNRSHELSVDLAAAAAVSIPPGGCSGGGCGSCASPFGAAAAAAAAPVSSADEPSLRHAAQLVLSNVLMWTTGAATAVSMLGLHALLDPDVPTHVPELGFVEGTLAWLARCSVPVSLFAMGLFTASRPGCGVEDGAAVRRLVAYLAIKLALLPALMVFVNSLLGLDGRLARSLVVLTCVPVGQNAFLVTEQYGEGAEAVTGVMQVGLVLMLPHVAGVMAALRWAGLYQEAVA